MADDKSFPNTPDSIHKRSRSYSFGWNPALGGFPKFSQGTAPRQGSMSMDCPSAPLAIPKARSSSISSMTEYGSADGSFKETPLSGFARRGSVSMPGNPMFRRRPSIDEERILKGEFSF